MKNQMRFLRFPSITKVPCLLFCASSDSLAPARLALRANLGLAFLKGPQPSRLCPLIHFVHSFGVAFGNLSPFGRLWLIPLNSS